MSAWSTTRESAIVWGYYPLDDATVEEVVAALLTSDAPKASLDVPWAAAAQRADGTVIAAVSPGFASGLFWTYANDAVTVGDHPADVVRSLETTDLDADYLISFLLLDAERQATPYAGVNRTPAGMSTVFGDAGSINNDLLRLREHPAPADPVSDYLAAFDAALATITPDGPLVATMSAGLDSTMVVGTLARTGRKIIALCHSPLPEAQLRSSGGWEPDDYPLAAQMEHAYPGQVRVECVRASADDHPLDAAHDGALKSWLPVFNPDNQMWLHTMSSITAEHGADRLFTGQFGNAALSGDHPYAASHHARRGQLRQARLAITRGTQPLTFKALVRTVREQARRRPVALPQSDYLQASGLGSLPPRRLVTNDRAGFLRFLHPGDSLYGSYTPAAWPAAMVDPYRSGRIIELAARIPPATWRQGGSRGFARAVGEGRVPDSIRLRTSRGGQARDVWYLMRNSRDRYLDEVHALASTPLLDGLVDATSVRATVSNWPWGQIDGPERLQIIAVNRLLSVAIFARESAARLRTGTWGRYSRAATFTRSIRPASPSADAT